MSFVELSLFIENNLVDDNEFTHNRVLVFSEWFINVEYITIIGKLLKSYES